MCLSIPAKLVSISGNDVLTRIGKVNLGGVFKEVSLAYVPEAKIGDYVLIHVGFAISIVNEQEAEFVFNYLRQTKELQ